MQDYQEFIESKRKSTQESGFESGVLNCSLFRFQEDIVRKAIKKGKYAIFADCGLGKTFMQLEWAYRVVKHTNNPVLVLAPLGVTAQTVKEGETFGIHVEKYNGQTKRGVYITNYEQLKNIDASIFSGVVLDESSILKNFTGAMRNQIIETFQDTPYKLACTATPSPNDPLELGSHSEFLNVMSSVDMRSRFFTTDKNLIGKNKYRLKKHATIEFYKWVSTWATMISKPSDIGFSDEGYDLPELHIKQHQLKTPKKDNGLLFQSVSVSATNYNQALRETKQQRLDKAIELAKQTTGQVIIWVKHNDEGEYIKKHLPEAVEVKGSDKPEYKENKLLGFGRNEFRILVTKIKIAQFGLNYQNCNTQIFAALDFSFEGLYQAIRRSYRFGQKNEVTAHLITTDTMTNVIQNINKKIKQHEEMKQLMQTAINEANKVAEQKEVQTYTTDWFKLINGDCVEETKKLPANSIDYSFFSPPFGALYVFSNDPKDMSNVVNNDEFYKHFTYLVKELLRVIKPGRLISIHIMQSTTLKGRDGFLSIVDFRGDLIRLFQSVGFYFHAENMIRKDPKTAAIRTKNRQLMHGTTKKDSSIVRPGLADYIITFRKPGENEVPIQNDIPFDKWCKIAEPVWLDIQEGDVLPYKGGRDEKDERHITPTQLGAIDNCLTMWCNKGETVFSPFSGVGSEGYQSVKTGRKFIGVELKPSYYEQSIKNIQAAEAEKLQTSLF